MTHEQKCDAVIEQLKAAEYLMYRVKAGSETAARQMGDLCRFISYEGQVFCIPVDGVLGPVLQPEETE